MFAHRKIIFFTVASLNLVASVLIAAETPSGDGKFSNESEAGVVLSTGNSSIRAFNFKQLNAYVWDANSVKFDGRFLGSTNNGAENARFFNLGLRYERALSDSFSLFAAETYQSDVFAGYDNRFNTDLGVKYNIVKDESTTWFVEAGYRHIAEKLVAGASNNRSNARVYTEATYLFTKSVSGKLWVEYIQSVENGKDALINTELSISVLLSEVLSLKTGYLLRYNNNPSAPAQTTDTTFTTSLVAKF